MSRTRPRKTWAEERKRAAARKSVAPSHVSRSGGRRFLPPANVVLELAVRGPKRVADGDIGVCMGQVHLGRTPDDDASAGDAKLDEHAIKTTLVVAVGSLDRYAAADGPVEQSLEVLDPLADVSFEGLAVGEL